ncbi:hypothetical protein [Algirhabdus cladophorae]|uniref:hypothetical protein n=1 Tax=Algirhabdus cladophorae TaxID=3377108 RepID=UPI003B8467FD
MIVYNKTDEVIAKRKLHWFEIWNHNLQKCPETAGNVMFGNVRKYAENADEMSCNETKRPEKHIVWRVEFRAGKKLLKDRWGIRTWEDFFDRFGDCCREIGEVIKYTKPSQTDPNRARWPLHPLWQLACSEINDDLFELRSGADPNPIKEVEREEHIALILRNILGCSITVAALEGAEREDLPKAIDTIATKLKAKMQADPKRSAKQLQDAKERYVFMAHVGKTHH